RAKSETRRTQFQRHLPRLQPFLDLLWELRRVGGLRDCFRREESAGLVLPMPETDSAPTIDHDIRAVHAQDANHILQWNLITPDSHGSLRALGEPGVHGAGKELMDSVVAAGSEQLGGAHNAERPILFGADGVLSPLAARDRQKGNVRMQTMREV